jgi:type II secretory pathway component PulK
MLPPPRQGAVFITALGIILILTGLVLVFGQRMRIETAAAANRASFIQADAIEKGAEMWVLSQVESYPADSVTITSAPAAGLSIGSGYFWVLHPDPTQDQTYQYGITDEAGKLNINTATSDEVMLLPNMTDQDIADSIVDWAASADDPPGPDGAQSDYYQSLPEPYECKNSPYETVEELLLVKDVTPLLLYGYDLNHDGVFDAAEQKIAGTGSMFGGVNGTTTDSRGIFNYVTCYSVEPNTTVSGGPRVNVNNRNTTALQNVLSAALSSSRSKAVMTQINNAIAGARSPNAIVFPTIGNFYTKSTMTSDEFALVADQLTASASTTLTGLINVNTASAQVLGTLPGLTESDAQSIISQRTSGANTGSIAWVFDALSATKAQAIAGDITARSFQYSADIVAVSGDGRAFKRVRIVVDSRTLPAQVIYRKDLTSLGWPLPAEVRDSLRAGRGVPDSAQGLGGSLNNALH